MDQSQFDAVARMLGAATTRRVGIGAALSALAGAVAGGAASAKHRAAGRPGAAGPCGDGSRKDNACRKDKDCCTGICNTAAGKKNRDGKGRCRCVKRGQPCAEDRNCCGGKQCVNGACGGGGSTPVPTGDACNAGSDVCANAAATCETYFDATPPGTYCVLPVSEACAADIDCESHSCVSGVCAAACIPNVCASGCDYTDVGAAWAALPSGGDIMIAPGTYPVGIDVDKSMTVRGCGDGVILQLKGGDSYIFYDAATSPQTLMLQRLTLEEPGTPGNYLLYANGNTTFNVTGCTFRNACTGMGGGGDLTPITFTDCVFKELPGSACWGIYLSDSDLSLKNCTFSDTYGAVLVDGGDLTVDGCTFNGQSSYAIDHYDTAKSATYVLTVKNSTFTNLTTSAVSADNVSGTIDGVTVTGGSLTGDGGGLSLGDGAFTITNTSISGNTVTGVGGGLLLYASAANTTVTLGTGVSVTGNTASNGSGVAAYSKNSKTLTIVGAPAAVSGNSGGDQCVTGPNYNGPWTAVSGCAY